MRPVVTLKFGKKKVVLKDTDILFLKYVCQDLGYKEIAAKMGKSNSTMHNYREELFMKLDVRSKAGLVTWCYRSGLLMGKVKLVFTKTRQKRKCRR